jgi:hypothetical protein
LLGWSKTWRRRMAQDVRSVPAAPRITEASAII